jgi:hypothetical protein
LPADVFSFGVLMWETLCSSPQRASSNPLAGADPDSVVAQVSGVALLMHVSRYILVSHWGSTV